MALFALLVCYAACAFILGWLPRNGSFRETTQGVDLYIRSNGVHTDILMPARFQGWDWRQQIAFPISSSDELLAFGWGDRAFYMDTPTWADLRATTAARALLGLDSTVVHVERAGIPGPSEPAVHLRVSTTQAARLAAYIKQTLQAEQGVPPAPLKGRRANQDGEFFAAHGHYSAFMTCNEWVRIGLDQAGIRTASWAPFDIALLYQWRQVQHETLH